MVTANITCWASGIRAVLAGNFEGPNLLMLQEQRQGGQLRGRPVLAQTKRDHLSHFEPAIVTKKKSKEQNEWLSSGVALVWRSYLEAGAPFALGYLHPKAAARVAGILLHLGPIGWTDVCTLYGHVQSKDTTM